MTFGYSVTIGGMARQIRDAYEEITGKFPEIPVRKPNKKRPDKLTEDPSRRLAEKVNEACAALLPGPTEMREYFRDCQEHLAKSNLPLSWINPTGLPISNRYFKPNIETVNIYRNGRRLRFDVAEGELPIIDQNGALDSVSPNVVHSMDAAHVVRVVLRAAEEGIRDVLTEHDSYSCLAPQATQFNQLIRRELALLYHCYNLLAVLRRAAGLKWQPNLGDLDPLEVQNAEWCWI